MEELTRGSTYDAAATIGTEIAFITNPDQSFWSHVRITYRARKQKKVNKQLFYVQQHFSLRTISHRTFHINGQ